jgi:hypothetical protein
MRLLLFTYGKMAILIATIFLVIFGVESTTPGFLNSYKKPIDVAVILLASTALVSQTRASIRTVQEGPFEIAKTQTNTGLAALKHLSSVAAGYLNVPGRRSERSPPDADEIDAEGQKVGEWTKRFNDHIQKLSAKFEPVDRTYFNQFPATRYPYYTNIKTEFETWVSYYDEPRGRMEELRPLVKEKGSVEILMTLLAPYFLVTATVVAIMKVVYAS